MCSFSFGRRGHVHGVGSAKSHFLTQNEWWKSIQLELWAQQSQLLRVMASKLLAAASPCPPRGPMGSISPAAALKNQFKTSPRLSLFPCFAALTFSPWITQRWIGRMPLPEHHSVFWGRIWGFWVEAAASELPGADLLPAQGLNHLFLGLLAKRDGFSTQPSRRSRCHFRVAFDHQLVKPS